MDGSCGDLQDKAPLGNTFKDPPHPLPFKGWETLLFKLRDGGINVSGLCNFTVHYPNRGNRLERAVKAL